MQNIQLFFGLKLNYSRDCRVPLPGLDREEQFNFCTGQVFVFYISDSRETGFGLAK